jgi:hypothetical protein
MMVDRTWAYGMTADEWLHLASEGEDSEVAPCCGNISQIREILQAITTCQAEWDAWLRISLGKQLRESLEADDMGHNLDSRESFPLLYRVLDGTAEEEKLEHERFARRP